VSLRLASNTNGLFSHRLHDAISLIANSGYQGIALTLDHHHLDRFNDDWQNQTA
jgi:D-psicose/D-tagatose/L-ribulose 3-epimerase